MKICSFLLGFSLIVIAVIATPPEAAWKPIDDVNSSNIRDLGAWTVDHHNTMANDHLVYQRVVSGSEMNTTKGYYHDLVINAMDSVQQSRNYNATLLIVDYIDRTMIMLLSFNVTNHVL